MKKHLLILGASSDIAKAIGREYASKGYNLYLAGRDVEDLQKDANDIAIEFDIEANVVYFDVLDFNSHYDFYRSLGTQPDGVVCAIGYLGNQKLSESNFSEAKKIIDTNFTGCMSILNIISNDFETRKSGFIIGISSVAGDRGRGSNYIYGSSKAALTAYLSGLRNRLSKSLVQVITVKPGFVATKMTKEMKLPKLLTANPKDVAIDTFKAHKNGKDIVYTKWFWEIIMLIIKLIPEKIYKQLKL